MLGLLAQVLLGLLEALGLSAAGLLDRPGGRILVVVGASADGTGLRRGGVRLPLGPLVQGVSLDHPCLVAGIRGVETQQCG